MFSAYQAGNTAHIQWNLSKVKWTPLGHLSAVLYREVALIQRYICTQLYVVGTAERVLIGGVPFIQSVLIERFHGITLRGSRCVCITSFTIQCTAQACAGNREAPKRAGRRV